MEIKLNLGSGIEKKPGYTNIDSRESVNPDLCCKIEDLVYEDNSVKEIYVSHLMEHFDPQIAKILFDRFYKWLKKGGKLFVAVPDLEVLSELIINGHTEDYVLLHLFGRADVHEEGQHRWGYTFRSIRNILEEIGFKVNGRFSPGGDTSGSWYKDGGRVMCISLNVEATKVD
jgi:predicted SAM-dependent methyltransferase